MLHLQHDSDVNYPIKSLQYYPPPPPPIISFHTSRPIMSAADDPPGQRISGRLHVSPRPPAPPRAPGPTTPPPSPQAGEPFLLHESRM